MAIVWFEGTLQDIRPAVTRSKLPYRISVCRSLRIYVYPRCRYMCMWAGVHCTGWVMCLYIVVLKWCNIYSPNIHSSPICMPHNKNSPKSRNITNVSEGERKELYFFIRAGFTSGDIVSNKKGFYFLHNDGYDVWKLGKAYDCLCTHSSVSNHEILF